MREHQDHQMAGKKFQRFLSFQFLFHIPNLSQVLGRIIKAMFLNSLRHNFPDFTFFNHLQIEQHSEDDQFSRLSL